MSDDEFRREWKSVLEDASCEPVQVSIYKSLSDVHVFILAHMLKRPIILLSPSSLQFKNSFDGCGNTMRGLFVPLCYDPEKCNKNPLIISWENSHFTSVVPVTSLDEFTFFMPLFDHTSSYLDVPFLTDPGDQFNWDEGDVSPDKYKTEAAESIIQMYFTLKTDRDGAHAQVSFYRTSFSVQLHMNYCRFLEEEVPPLFSSEVPVDAATCNETGNSKFYIPSGLSQVIKPTPVHAKRKSTSPVESEEPVLILRKSKFYDGQCSSSSVADPLDAPSNSPVVDHAHQNSSKLEIIDVHGAHSPEIFFKMLFDEINQFSKDKNDPIFYDELKKFIIKLNLVTLKEKHEE